MLETHPDSHRSPRRSFLILLAAESRDLRPYATFRDGLLPVRVHTDMKLASPEVRPDHTSLVSVEFQVRFPP